MSKRFAAEVAEDLPLADLGRNNPILLNKLVARADPDDFTSLRITLRKLGVGVFEGRESMTRIDLGRQ